MGKKEARKLLSDPPKCFGKLLNIYVKAGAGRGSMEEVSIKSIKYYVEEHKSLDRKTKDVYPDGKVLRPLEPGLNNGLVVEIIHEFKKGTIGVINIPA